MGMICLHIICLDTSKKSSKEVVAVLVVHNISFFVHLIARFEIIELHLLFMSLCQICVRFMSDLYQLIDELTQIKKHKLCGNYSHSIRCLNYV